MVFRSKLLKLFFSIALPFILLGCDPSVAYHLSESSSQPLVCPGNAPMKYRVAFEDKWGNKDETEFSVTQNPFPLSTDPDHPVVGLINPPEYVAWVQFTIYCGDSNEPFLVTKKISVKDWVKKDDGNYYYYLK